MKVYVQSLKDPGKRYEVVKYNEQTKAATLRGQYADFEIKPFNKANLTAKGYRLVTEG